MAAKTKTAPAGRLYTPADWDDVSDNPEWTAEEMAKAKPFAEVLPELAASARRVRGKQKAPTKQLVSLRLDRSIIEAFKAEGPGWQSRINEALKRTVGALPADSARAGAERRTTAKPSGASRRRASNS